MIRIKYINNQLNLSALSELISDSEMHSIWIMLREDCWDWSADFKDTMHDGKYIPEHFMWNGMSTWWLSPLVMKDTDISTVWLNRLMVLYICKNFHNIHSELLDVFYSYMENLNHINIKLVYILVTEQISFLHENILKSSKIIPVIRPKKTSYQKILKNKENFEVPEFYFL